MGHGVLLELQSFQTVPPAYKCNEDATETSAFGKCTPEIQKSIIPSGWTDAIGNLSEYRDYRRGLEGRTHGLVRMHTLLTARR